MIVIVVLLFSLSANSRLRKNAICRYVIQIKKLVDIMYVFLKKPLYHSIVPMQEFDLLGYTLRSARLFFRREKSETPMGGQEDFGIRDSGSRLSLSVKSLLSV